MMKKAAILVITCFLLSIPGLGICNSNPIAWTGNINVFLGTKSLESEWEAADQQDELGIEVDFRQERWPVSIAIDLLRGSDDGTSAGIKYESDISEFNIGVRKIWDEFPQMRPFVGGGVSFIAAEFRKTGTSDHDSATGIWLGGGVYWTLAERFNVGLEAKYSDAEVTLFDSDIEAGGTHLGLLIGYHW